MLKPASSFTGSNWGTESNRKIFKYFKIFRLYLDSEEYAYRRDSPLGTNHNLGKLVIALEIAKRI